MSISRSANSSTASRRSASPASRSAATSTACPIGAPQFDPFFEACEQLGAAVFVHAIRPAGMERLVGPAPLQQVIGYPGDVGLAAASVITTNLIERRPKLRIAFSHGGGTLAMLLPRLQQGWGVFPALKESITAAPVEQARKLFYDTLVFDAPTLRHLVGTFGASQLLIGTDYPFNFHDRTPVQRIEEAGFDEATARQLVQHNAERFLGIALKETNEFTLDRGRAQRRAQHARPGRGRALLHAGVEPRRGAIAPTTPSICAAAAATVTCWRCSRAARCRRSAT
jgi:predicted TIM-barrel fold metal-dependent hydrolase